MKNSFNIWAFGDAHVGTDIKKCRRSLADAIRQSEFGEGDAPAFDWDIAIDVGDMCGCQGLPEDNEGMEIVNQLSELKTHNREDIYSVAGNHDRGKPGEDELSWWRKWIDPLGQNTKYSCVNPEKRRYPISGTPFNYSFRVGNILFLMMSDINEPTQKIGRGELGGNPAGVVSGETFRWWTNMVEQNQGSIIITVHHYMLKNTTVASGEWEGFCKDEKGNYKTYYHGYKERGEPKGASYLYWVDSKPDSMMFENYLASRTGAIDLWLGGHTHTNPDDKCGGKSHIETKWGVHFLNVCALTKHHAFYTAVPMSRLLTFVPGSDIVKIKCYLHTNDYTKKGWYSPSERYLKLNKVFEY